MENRPAISIDNLTKRYAPAKGESEGKLALKGVSFDVPQGGIFGLLGIHHFYLKNWLHGIFDLSLFVTAYWLFLTATSGGVLALAVGLLVVDLTHTVFVMYFLFSGQCRDGDGQLVLYPGQRA